MKYYSLAIMMLLQSATVVSAKHHLKHQSVKSSNHHYSEEQESFNKPGSHQRVALNDDDEDENDADVDAAINSEKTNSAAQTIANDDKLESYPALD